MSVGGVEARHAAILAGVLGQAPVTKAFQITDSYSSISFPNKL